MTPLTLLARNNISHDIEYSPKAEEKIMEAVLVFKKDSASGELSELGDKDFAELKLAAQKFG
jgi:hypothetical protein